MGAQALDLLKNNERKNAGPYYERQRLSEGLTKEEQKNKPKGENLSTGYHTFVGQGEAGFRHEKS